MTAPTHRGLVKAWHVHRIQVDNFACLAGMAAPRHGDPDEHRIDPHGTLPDDWTHNDG